MAQFQVLNPLGALAGVQGAVSQGQGIRQQRQQNRLSDLMEPYKMQQAQMQQERMRMSNQQLQGAISDEDRVRLGRDAQLYLQMFGPDLPATLEEADARHKMALQGMGQAGVDIQGMPEGFDPDFFDQAEAFAAESQRLGGKADSIQSTFVDDKGRRVALYRSGKQQVLGGAFSKPIKVNIGGREMIMDPATRQVTDPATGQVLGGFTGFPGDDGKPPAPAVDRTKIAQEETSIAAERERALAEARAKGAADAEAGSADAIASAQNAVAENMAVLNRIDEIIPSNLTKQQQIARLDKIYGRGESVFPELARSQEGINLLAQRDFVLNNLSMENAQKLKGQGQITENEREMLKQASTILGNPNISPELAYSEIMRIRDMFAGWAEANRARASGKGGSANPAATMSDGGMSEQERAELEALRRAQR